MKRFLTAALAVLFIVAGIGAAYAAMNLRQKADGQAEWQTGKGTNYNVARANYSVLVASLATASSDRVTIPEPGILSAVYCNMSELTLITANVEIGVSVPDANVGKRGTVTFQSDQVRLKNAARATGMSTRVTRGSYVLLTNSGTGGGASPAWCTVVVIPDVQNADTN